MSTLAVVKFTNATGAAALWAELIALQLQGAITLADGVVVVRRPDGTARVQQVMSRVGPCALGGAILGLLVGLVVGVPWLGLAAGAGAGALVGRLLDLGLDATFIAAVSAAIEPGESALFVLARQVAQGRGARAPALLRRRGHLQLAHRRGRGRTPGRLWHRGSVAHDRTLDPNVWLTEVTECDPAGHTKRAVLPAPRQIEENGSLPGLSAGRQTVDIPRPGYPRHQAKRQHRQRSASDP
jgi:uncharacterized membrane protein